jgi:hypothetical protein
LTRCVFLYCPLTEYSTAQYEYNVFSTANKTKQEGAETYEGAPEESLSTYPHRHVSRPLILFEFCPAQPFPTRSQLSLTDSRHLRHAKLRHSRRTAPPRYHNANPLCHTSYSSPRSFSHSANVTSNFLWLLNDHDALPHLDNRIATSANQTNSNDHASD